MIAAKPLGNRFAGEKSEKRLQLVFAFAYSLVAFFALLLLFVRVLKIYLGLLYSLDVSRCRLGARWGPIGMNRGCYPTRNVKLRPFPGHPSAR
jgi:hypothetical protein